MVVSEITVESNFRYCSPLQAPKLLVVFLGKTEWREKAHPEDVPDRLRTCMLLDRILAAHHVSCAEGQLHSRAGAAIQCL